MVKFWGASQKYKFYALPIFSKYWWFQTKWFTIKALGLIKQAWISVEYTNYCVPEF